MDVVHKAGKQLHKDIQNYYNANPEFATKAPTVEIEDDSSAAAASQGKPKKGKKKGKRAQAAEEEEEKLEIEAAEERKKAKVADLIATGGEVSALDSVNMALTDESIGK